MRAAGFEDVTVEPTTVVRRTELDGVIRSAFSRGAKPRR